MSKEIRPVCPCCDVRDIGGLSIENRVDGISGDIDQTLDKPGLATVRQL
ncbi:hypothetical protein [Janthinobacterium sp. 75]|nr:hypothetical protein [Janthinobacterium sp. 75]